MRKDYIDFNEKIVIFILPIVIFILYLSVKINLPSTYLLLIQEDSFIEYLQAFFYVFSAILSTLISIKLIRKKLLMLGILYIVLTFGLIFISCEELSWGQRIFNIKNPDYFKQHNVQNELTIHNLDIIQPLLTNIYIIIGGYGTFAWIFVKKFRKYNFLYYIAPEWYLSSYFFFVFLIYVTLGFISPYAVSIGLTSFSIGFFLQWRDQEPVELLLSAGFLLFTLNSYIKLRRPMQPRR